MKESSNIVWDLEVFSGILIRCFFVGVIFVLIWFILFIVGGDAGYAIHAKLFQISRHEYDLVNYYGMALTKAGNFLFPLFPYLAIRMMPGKYRASMVRS